MKAKILFLSVTFFTVTFWQWSYYRFAQHFNGLPEAEIKIGLLEEELAREKAMVSLAQYQLNDFKESVAKVIPEFSKPPLTEHEVKLRDLASVVKEEANPALVKVSIDEKIEKAAVLFADGKYEASTDILKPLLQGEVLAAQAIRGHFILVESYFQQQLYPECLEQVRAMVSQFPESEMTGYALLRMGIILKEQRRVDEASETFQVVAKSFRDEKLQLKAKLLAGKLKAGSLE